MTDRRSVGRLDHHLHALPALPFVQRQPVGQAHALGQRLGVAEPDRVAQRAADGARAASGAFRPPGAAAARRPRRRTPAPRSPGPRPARPARPRSAALNHSQRQRPVGAQRARQRRGVQPLARPPPASAASKTGKPASARVQPAAIAWPPKRSSTPGWRLATRSSASRR